MHFPLNKYMYWQLNKSLSKKHHNLTFFHIHRAWARIWSKNDSDLNKAINCTVIHTKINRLTTLKNYRVYQGFPVVCLSSSSCFSSSVNCKSSSKELLSRSWMYCSMLLLDLCGGVDSCGDRECDELDWATCMLLNWLRRSSYWDRGEKV